jgi:deoxyribodipyrimidine photo-lyase
LDDQLQGYGSGRNEPAAYQCSFLSPYLHFGQISPVEVALAVRRSAAGSADDRSAYVEELIVRRELAINFAHHQPDYDRYTCLPEWARETLANHRDDRRDPVYTIEQLEAAATHDRHWNAAMQEMVATGFMHNYMRMYWAKQILIWSPTPEIAYQRMLDLNNKHFLDGRDPNSYANVAWTLGLHDRPWPERAIFGKVRSMTASGLERKFDMASYRLAVARLVAAEEA